MRSIFLVLTLMSVATPFYAQTDDWQQRVQAEVQAQHLDSALDIVEKRLAAVPDDYEARGWHGRLLAWKGRWTDGEREYRLVLEKYPDDVDILIGLSDVLLWQQRYPEAFQALKHAKTIAPSNPEVLSRMARILTILGRPDEAQLEYQNLLQFDPQNKEARAVLLENAKQELRVGNDTDFFNFTNDAETQTVSLTSRWNHLWSSAFAVNTYQRFGQNAVKIQGAGTFHVRGQTWVSAGAGVGNHQTIVPTSEAFFELGHAFHFDNRWVQGLESSLQQHWFWYQGAHVLTLSTNQIVYLPKGWMWTMDVTGARSSLTETVSGWEPSGWSKLGFPLFHRLSGNVLYGVGNENFSQIDQLEQFSAHTYGGGLHYQFADRQDVQGYVARQERSQGLTDTTLGISYGIRF